MSNLIVKVDNCPRKNVILRKVIKTSASNIIDFHKILIVTNLSIFPHLTHSLSFLLDCLPINNPDVLFQDKNTSFS